MNHRIQAIVQRQPGALQRVLVTASRRGYEPIGISACREGAMYWLELEVESERPIAMLVRALEALFDVHFVEAIS